MKKIVVLGAGGFAGRSLTEYFLAKAEPGTEVIPVTRKQVDLCDASSVSKFIRDTKPSVVINCAAVGGSRKNGYSDGGDVADTNFRLFENVENALQDFPDTVHIIFGSGAQYDKSKPLVKVPETALFKSRPSDPYGLGKYRIAEYAASRGRERTLMPVIFGLFGPYEDYTYKFISNACVKTLVGMDIVINRNVRFDYLYVDDFCAIIGEIVNSTLAGKALPHKIFNLTPTDPVTLLEIAGLIRDIAGKYGDVRVPDIKVLNEGIGNEYTGANDFLLENLGGSFSFLPFEESVTRLFENLRSRLPGLDIESVRADAALKFCAK